MFVDGLCRIPAGGRQRGVRAALYTLSRSTACGGGAVGVIESEAWCFCPSDLEYPRQTAGGMVDHQLALGGQFPGGGDEQSCTADVDETRHPPVGSCCQ